MHRSNKRPGPALLAVVLTALPLAAGADDHGERAAGGKELYLAYQCWQCHGYEGQGGAAPRVAPSEYPYEAFVRFVRYPNVMPAYPTELLPEEDLRAIYDYLQTIPAPPPVEDIPALDDL
ncbi:MAG: cytochrome c [Woeseiaceae bacterium]|nr:cytochrome c [Woeseiaceae bacterium]